jgi:hypothetical protein
MWFIHLAFLVFLEEFWTSRRKSADFIRFIFGILDLGFRLFIGWVSLVFKRIGFSIFYRIGFIGFYRIGLRDFSKDQGLLFFLG